MFKRAIHIVLAAVLILQTQTTTVAYAQGKGLSIIRDVEIETILWEYLTPILRVAGINREAMTLNLVADNSLNAFVAGGPNLFLFTGLLNQSDSPEQIIGVMAHEVGHIAGSHNTRTREYVENLQITSLLTMILGMAAAVASGQGQLAGAAAMGPGALAANSFLAYSRVQESAADQAGLTYLENIGVSAKGLRDFLRVLENQEFLSANRQSPYFRTHPVTRERIALINRHLDQSPYTDAPLPESYYRSYQIMKAKLFAFLNPPGATFELFPESDQTLPARYARAIAYYRTPDLKRAIPAVDALIAEDPDNPFYRELKGQMLFENGRVEQAVEPYRKAVRLLPTSTLLRTQLAQVLIELNDPGLNREALAHLKESSRNDVHNGLTWHLLAVAYGREGNIGMSALSLAESALLRGDREQAIGQAERAMDLLDRGSVDWLRAESIRDDAEDLPQPDNFR